MWQDVQQQHAQVNAAESKNHLSFCIFDEGAFHAGHSKLFITEHGPCQMVSVKSKFCLSALHVA
jgi:hypothetical protein